MPPACDKAAERRALCLLFIQMCDLRIELAGKCDDLLRSDGVHSRHEMVSYSEIVQVDAATLNHLTAPPMGRYYRTADRVFPHTLTVR